MCYLATMNLNGIMWQQAAAGGGLIILMQLGAYIWGIDMMLSTWVSVSGFLLVVLAMVLGTVAVRANEEGFISFGRAFYHALASAAVASLMGTGFQMFLTSIVDSDLADKLVDASMDEIEEKMGALASQLPGGLDEMRNQVIWAMSPSGQMLSWLLGLIFWALVALIVAAILKRENPNSLNLG
jgi:hypothetical protein